MSEVLKISKELIDERSVLINETFTIRGLPKGNVGFLISPPGSGKSYLSLALSYSLSLEPQPIPIRGSPNPLRVLYWPAEDKANATLARIGKHIEEQGDEFLQSIEERFSLYEEDNPLFEYKNGLLIENQSTISGLIDAAKDYDVLIIDTIREAAGPAHEVEHDFEIKCASQRIAKEADVSLLLVHHPTKSVTRGVEQLSSASGSGLSLTMANARLQLYLKPPANKKKDKPVLSFLKSNFLAGEEAEDISLNWSKASLLYADSFSGNIVGEVKKTKSKQASPFQEQPERFNQKEPKVLNLNHEEIANQAVPDDPDAADFFSSLNEKLKDS